jgi:hypothetical protein
MKAIVLVVLGLVWMLLPEKLAAQDTRQGSGFLVPRPAPKLSSQGEVKPGNLPPSAAKQMQAAPTVFDSLRNEVYVPLVNKIEFRALTSNLGQVKQGDSLQRLWEATEETLKPRISSFERLEDKPTKLQSSGEERLRRRLDHLGVLNKYDGEEWLQLPHLPGALVPSQNLRYLDSLRKASLSNDKLKIKEKQITQAHKDVMLKEKSSLLERSYFEGIVGINNRLQYLTFSPSLGVCLIKSLSAGLGFNVGLNTHNLSSRTMLGVRSFARYELVRKKITVQIEDNTYFSKFSEDPLKEAAGSQMKHLFYVGLGYLVNYSSNKSLSLTSLYQINRGETVPLVYSPFIVRIGISVFNKNSTL